MTYEVYRTIQTKEEYFSSWDQEDLKKISKKTKNDIYDNYVVKAQIFQRDNFTCVNTVCQTPNSELTWHHIKKRKNGGDNTIRNGVTLCDSCHKAFHRGKRPIVFSTNENLPPHVRGHTLWEHTPDEFDWKEHKSKMRSLRKKLQQQGKVKYITWEEIYLLLQFLFSEWDED